MNDMAASKDCSEVVAGRQMSIWQDEAWHGHGPDAEGHIAELPVAIPDGLAS
ncbi:MAG: hypothetical protein LBQ79_06025 [Deltaproteobacteria bacterium]|jgi:hypothetical protein|nr:hypothetical protein [Deltaproteobacteria bacterium]